MPKLRTIFVYGTLRPVNNVIGQVGQMNRKWEKPTHSLPGYVMRSYYDRYPFIQPGSDGKVMGQLIHVDDETLDTLDWVEGVGVKRGQMFKRIKANVYNVETGEKVRAHAYVVNRLVRPGEDPGPVITEGDWALYRLGDKAYAA